jgi:membrane protein DedA with SNARE-associated domain
MAESLSELLAQYGYVLLAVLLFVEAVGLPIPGETALVTAAALAGQGTLTIEGVFLAACVGTIGGCATGYWLGVRKGKGIVDRFGKTLHLNAARLERAHAFFDKHGKRALIAGRFVPLLRSFLGVFAGISGMQRREFAIYNTVGGVVWAGTFCFLGFLFGRNLPRVVHQLGRLSLVIALAVGVVILLQWGWRWYSVNRVRVTEAIDRTWDRLLGTQRMERLRGNHPTAWLMVSSRLASVEYLIVHLLVGAAVSAAVLGFFGVITEDVIEGAPLTLVDQALANRLFSTASPELLALLRWVAGAGSPLAMAIIALLLCALFITQKRWIGLVAWMIAYAGSIGLDVTLRHIVRRSEQPFAAASAIDDLGSLPTGHTIGAIVGYGMLAYALRRYSTHIVYRGVLVALAVTIVVTIVAGRLVLGLGFLSTEAAAVACGVLWLATAISGAELAEYQRRRNVQQ